MPSPTARSPEKFLDIDVCAIGAGSGGLSITRYATAQDLSCVLIERGLMGGDCLNGGCVPSKALLAAGHAAASVRRAHEFGVFAKLNRVADAGVYRHVRDTVAWVEPNDSQERYESYGATVLRERARFVGPGELRAGPYRVRARRFFIATGARAAIPEIAGLESVPYLTNETLFALKRLPRHLMIIGAGPLGVEMAQAHCRLGARVTMIEKATMLPNEDPELVDHLRRRLTAEGVEIIEGANIKQVRRGGSGIEAVLGTNGRCHVIRGSDLLVATGRRPEIEALDLKTAGIRYTDRGIMVDRYLRTTNPRVYAIGDVIGAGQLSHLAVHHAMIAFGNAFRGAKAEVASVAVPRVIYTEPEFAQVGLKESDARKAHRGFRVLRWVYDHNDRAAAERTPWGASKVIVNRAGRILGAGIVAPHAGEVIQKWVLAISAGLGIDEIAKMVAPYPTLGYSDRKLAEMFEGPAIPGPRKRTASVIAKRTRRANRGSGVSRHP